MENSVVKKRILAELEGLISRSCKRGSKTHKFRKLHQLILKKHYNAAEVAIDYHRHRVTLDVVINDAEYDPMSMNTNLSTFRANLLFGNLKDFLKSCVETDSRSLAFYVWLLRTYDHREVPLSLA